jgi:hypothetical protein
MRIELNGITVKGCLHLSQANWPSLMLFNLRTIEGIQFKIESADRASEFSKIATGISNAIRNMYKMIKNERVALQTFLSILNCFPSMKSIDSSDSSVDATNNPVLSFLQRQRYNP